MEEAAAREAEKAVRIKVVGTTTIISFNLFRSGSSKKDKKGNNKRDSNEFLNCVTFYMVTYY